MKIWTADCGNTRIKFRYHESEDSLRELRGFSIGRDRDGRPDLHEWEHLPHNPTLPLGNASAMACTRPEDCQAIGKILQTLAPERAPFQLHHGVEVPFRYHYGAGAPGPDRLAAALALLTLFPDQPAVAFDCGTAINSVAVDDGEFLGGSIMPGINLMSDALVRATHSVLPAAEFGQSSIDYPSASTPGAIRTGILLGAAGAIEKLAREWRATLKGRESRYVLTGGAAALVAPYLEGDQFEIITELVSFGLAHFGRYRMLRS